MNRASRHTFQVLTKRPDRVAILNDRLSWTQNIWLGTSIESERWLGRLERLRETSARTRFLSLEPLLGPLQGIPLQGVDWVIVGGESGPGARPIEARVGARDPGQLRALWRSVLLQTVGRCVQEEDRAHVGRQDLGSVAGVVWPCRLTLGHQAPVSASRVPGRCNSRPISGAAPCRCRPPRTRPVRPLSCSRCWTRNGRRARLPVSG